MTICFGLIFKSLKHTSEINDFGHFKKIKIKTLAWNYHFQNYSKIFSCFLFKIFEIKTEM